MSGTVQGAASAAPAVLSEADARALTDEVKADVQALWTKLTRLYEGGAHTALGYDSWGSYWTAEFGGAGSRGYHLLDAGRIVRCLEAQAGSTSGRTAELPENERVARELKPLAEKPEKMAKAWEEVVEEAKPAKPTAEQVKTKVRKVKAEEFLKTEPTPEPPPVPPPAPKRKAKSVITGKAGLSHDPRVVRWVRERYGDGWVRDRIVAASVNKTDGWPLPDEALTNGGVSECRAAIVAIERCERQVAKAHVRDRNSRRRLREFWALRRGGDMPLLAEVAEGVAKVAAYLESFDLETYDLGDDVTAWEFEKLYETLVDLQMWAVATTTFVDRKVTKQRKLEIIRHLRTNHDGMGEHEKAAALKAADKLEARLNGPRHLTRVAGEDMRGRRRDNEQKPGDDPR